MPRTKRALRAEDIYRIRAVSDPQISPDGKWIACTISQLDRDQDRRLSDIWLIATKGRRRVQLTNRFHRDSSPRWSPDGRRIAFLSPERDESGASQQIWVIPVGGGEAQQLTHLEQGAFDPVWSPDGKKLAFVARDPKPEDEKSDQKKPKLEVKHGRVFATDVMVVDRIRYRSSQFPTKEERHHIYVVSASGGKERQLTGGDCNDGAPAWSPDGKQIAFVSDRGRDPDWEFMSDVWIAPTRGGTPRQLSVFAGGAASPVWSRDGKHVIYTASSRAKPPWADLRLWRHPVSGGKPVCLTSHLDRSPLLPALSPAGDAVYFSCYDNGFWSLWRATLRGEVARVLPAERCVEGFSVAKEAGGIAFTHSAPDHPSEMFACGPDGEDERRLTNENQAFLRSRQLGETESFWARSFDGQKVQGWVVRPPGFRAGRKHPLVLQVHGGPYGAFLHSWRFEAQVLAARGYLVVYSNPRGSIGYGSDFQVAVTGKFGAEDSRDCLAAMDHIVRQGAADRSRLGVSGGSYGGFMTVWLLGATNRFAAGVATCAFTDAAMLYYSADLPLWMEMEFGGPPWEHLESFRKSSPSTHAPAINAPLLLLHAVDDLRVPISNSEMVYTTLKRRGVESVFVRYPSGGHGFRDSAPRYTCDALNRTGDWFDQHLKTAGPRRPRGRAAKARK